MPRPNRKTVEAFYDIFADLDPEEQAIAMRVLEQTHRLAKRAAPKAATDKPEQISLPALPTEAPGDL